MTKKQQSGSMIGGHGIKKGSTYDCVIYFKGRFWGFGVLEIKHVLCTVAHVSLISCMASLCKFCLIR